MLVFLIALGTSAFITLLTIRWTRGHGHMAADADMSGPQKFHSRPVPRIGGIGITLGLACGMGALWWRGGAAVGHLPFLLLACGAPAFCAGLLEDLTKRVTPRHRLAATALSALAAVWAIDATITRTDLLGLDLIASSALGGALLAVFTVAGIANAVNIIDGFNGLASMCVLMMLLAITYVATQVGDPLIAALALMGAGAVLGFFIWNFPGGLIFLGDGGAYFLGFYLAELGILLVHRNPEVSPLFPLLMCVYPIFETLFSIYRKKFLRGMSPGVPDGVHLHMLVYKRLIRWAVGSREALAKTRRNSFTSPYLWMLCTMAIVPSVLWWNDSRVLGVFICLFAVTYVSLYWKIVRFRSPRWLVLRR